MSITTLKVAEVKNHKGTTYYIVAETSEMVHKIIKGLGGLKIVEEFTHAIWEEDKYRK